jgi:hypothetical protein
MPADDMSAYLRNLLANRTEQTYDVEHLGERAFLVEIKDRGYRVSVEPVAAAVDLPEWFEKSLREQLPEPEEAVAAARELLAAVIRSEQAMTQALRAAAGVAAPLLAHGIAMGIAELGYSAQVRGE